MKTDILIVGGGCAGLFCALNLPPEKKILIITKGDLESSDSFLAQGGMCMLADESDYKAYFEDTMKAGHYKNDPKSVEIMIRSSKEIVDDLLSIGTEFNRNEDGSFAFTREGAHSSKRILFHKDITGREITTKLLQAVQKLPNVTLLESTAMVDLIEDGEARGIVAKMPDGSFEKIYASYTVLATGGIGGLYDQSTNFKILTGDGVWICLRHGVELKDISYIQIHPTTLYAEKKEERSFLISESVRGEGAKLYDKNMKRFVNELLPRDILAQRIIAQMKADGTAHVWEDMRTIERKELFSHFPNIVEECRKRGFDVTKECVPIVPAQHYFMGGIKVGYFSETSMPRLYAVGETACNGVHGANRLASNSLLESLVFAKRAAKKIAEIYTRSEFEDVEIDFGQYDEAYFEEMKKKLLDEIEEDRWQKIIESRETSGYTIH